MLILRGIYLWKVYNSIYKIWKQTISWKEFSSLRKINDIPRCQEVEMQHAFKRQLCKSLWAIWLLTKINNRKTVASALSPNLSHSWKLFIGSIHGLNLSKRPVGHCISDLLEDFEQVLTNGNSIKNLLDRYNIQGIFRRYEEAFKILV